MAGTIHTQTIYRSETVSVIDVRCRPHGAACSVEELSDVDSIAFPRAGLFVKHVGREQAVIDPNQVLFFNRDEVYRVSHPIAGGDDCTSFEFATHVLRDALGRFDPSVVDRECGLFPLTQAPSDRRSVLLQQGIRRASRTRSSRDIELDELALELLAAVVGSMCESRGQRSKRCRPDTRRAHARLADMTKQFLGDRFRDPLSLDEIARSVHSSPYHLSRVFRRNVGLSIHKYMNRLRLRASLERLGDGESDLSRLALHLGYTSHSHFTDAFTREFGVAPSRFRAGLSASRLRKISKNLEV